jgi:hypothetical protein
MENRMKTLLETLCCALIGAAIAIAMSGSMNDFFRWLAR